MTTIEPLYDKKYRCSICSHTFTSKKIRSRFIKIESIDIDFCPTYSDTENNPILYQMTVCPNCGFSSQTTFQIIIPLEQETIKKKYGQNGHHIVFPTKEVPKRRLIPLN